MSQEDLEALRSLYAAFGRLAEGEDVASYVIAHYDPDCEYQPVEEDEAIRGHDALVRWNQRWFEVWDEFHVDVDEFIEVGDGVVVAAFTAHGRGAESEMHVDQQLFHVCELRNGKVFRVREYLERDEALEAVRQGS
jgi:ketosteroid isomerase-like protein